MYRRLAYSYPYCGLLSSGCGHKVSWEIPGVAYSPVYFRLKGRYTLHATVNASGMAMDLRAVDRSSGGGAAAAGSPAFTPPLIRLIAAPHLRTPFTACPTLYWVPLNVSAVCGDEDEDEDEDGEVCCATLSAADVAKLMRGHGRVRDTAATLLSARQMGTRLLAASLCLLFMGDGVGFGSAAAEGGAEGKAERKLPTAGAAAHEATLGDKALKGGNGKQAMNHYNKALELDPTNADIYVKRATGFMVTGKTDKARKDLVQQP
jgi:hypothetical protein